LKLPFISLNSQQISQNSAFVDENNNKKLNSNMIDAKVSSLVQRKHFRDNIFKKIQEKC
jgi:cytidylate kinase